MVAAPFAIGPFPKKLPDSLAAEVGHFGDGILDGLTGPFQNRPHHEQLNRLVGKPRPLANPVAQMERRSAVRPEGFLQGERILGDFGGGEGPDQKSAGSGFRAPGQKGGGKTNKRNGIPLKFHPLRKRCRVLVDSATNALQDRCSLPISPRLPPEHPHRFFMRIPILMPQLGESIAEATLLRMDVAAGDWVTADQDIMEVETQKATMGVTIPCSGQVLSLDCRVGTSYPVGTVLGYLLVTEAEALRAGMGDGETPPPPEAPAEPADDTAGLHFRVDAAPSLMSGAFGVQPTLSTGLPVPVNAAGAHYISPRLRARMQEMGLNAADLSAVAGSGAGGRVTVEDFEAFMRELEQHRTTPASPMRIAVADSMRRSWTRPLATVGIRVHLDPLLAHRKQQAPHLKAGPALYALRALAIALAENTAMAGRLVGKRIVHPKAIDLGFAVEVDDGVLVPVIRNVETKHLALLVSVYNDLVEKARTRKLPPDARGPGIATITNYGTFGIQWATPIPLPEQNLVLGLGAGEKSPVWDEASASFLPRTQADLTLSFDHRVLDGGGAGRLLARVASLMSSPEEL